MAQAGRLRQRGLTVWKHCYESPHCHEILMAKKIIHSVFIIAYTTTIFFTYRNDKAVNNSKD